MLSIFAFAIVYKIWPTKNRRVDIIYFRIGRFVLFFIAPFGVHIPILYLKQKREEFPSLLDYSAADKHTATCLVICVRGHDTREHYVKATQFWFFR